MGLCLLQSPILPSDCLIQREDDKISAPSPEDGFNLDDEHLKFPSLDVDATEIPAPVVEKLDLLYQTASKTALRQTKKLFLSALCAVRFSGTIRQFKESMTKDDMLTLLEDDVLSHSFAKRNHNSNLYT